MWRQPVLVGETPNQVRLVPTQVTGDGIQPKVVGEMALQVVTQCHSGGARWSIGLSTPGEPMSDARDDLLQPALPLEIVSGVIESLVQPRYSKAQLAIVETRILYGPSDQGFADCLEIEIEHPFAKSTTRVRRRTIVSDVRWQDSDPSRVCPAVVMPDVVADESGIDDEDRPGLMRVRWVDVVGESGVEDLGEAIETRIEGTNSLVVSVR